MNKILLLILFGLTLYATTAYAISNCENDEEFNMIVNDCKEDIDTNTQQGNEAGLGADVILWKNINDEALFSELFGEYRYDIDNRNHKIYGVVRLNLWDKIRSFFKKKNKE